MLTAEHLLDLAGLHFLVECVETLSDFEDSDGLAGLHPFGENSQVVALLLSDTMRSRSCSTGVCAARSLGFGLVFPKSGRRLAPLCEQVLRTSGLAASKIATQIGRTAARIFRRFLILLEWTSVYLTRRHTRNGAAMVQTVDACANVTNPAVDRALPAGSGPGRPTCGS